MNVCNAHWFSCYLNMVTTWMSPYKHSCRDYVKPCKLPSFFQFGKRSRIWRCGITREFNLCKWLNGNLNIILVYNRSLAAQTRLSASFFFNPCRCIFFVSPLTSWSVVLLSYISKDFPSARKCNLNVESHCNLFAWINPIKFRIMTLNSDNLHVHF